MMGNQSSGERKRDPPASVRDLEAVVRTTTLLPRRYDRRDEMPLKTKTNDYNQVFKNIYVSSAPFARSLENLHKVGITHVLNCGQGTSFMHVNTNEDYYKHSGITYHGLKAQDSFLYDLSQHFDDACEFIDSGMQANGKVLVHCVQGWSRSPTIVAVYLMKVKKMSARQALKTIRSKREVHPNQGFLELLSKLDKELYDQEFGQDSQLENTDS